MLDTLKNWRVRRTLARHPIGDGLWRRALRQCGPAHRLGASDQAELRVLATLFLRRKAVEPAQGVTLDDADLVLLAMHASLPILKLGIDWYNGWHSVIVYPAAFMPRRHYVDEAGVEHRGNAVLAGEAWQRGPVILAWEDVLRSGQPAGQNVVVHEMAHKLDMVNGSANGYPPLHRGMDSALWARTFSAAFEALRRARNDGQDLPLNPYALENPAEFFAVASEAFFETPTHLREHLPDVYRQLGLFYRQWPAGD